MPRAASRRRLRKRRRQHRFSDPFATLPPDRCSTYSLTSALTNPAPSRRVLSSVQYYPSSILCAASNYRWTRSRLTIQMVLQLRVNFLHTLMSSGSGPSHPDEEEDEANRSYLQQQQQLQQENQQGQKRRRRHRRRFRLQLLFLLPQLPQVVTTSRMAMSGELFSATTRSISENVIPPSRGGGSLGHQLAANHRVQRVVEAEGEPESDC